MPYGPTTVLVITALTMGSAPAGAPSLGMRRGIRDEREACNTRPPNCTELPRPDRARASPSKISSFLVSWQEWGSRQANNSCAGRDFELVTTLALSPLPGGISRAQRAAVAPLAPFRRGSGGQQRATTYWNPEPPLVNAHARCTHSYQRPQHHAAELHAAESRPQAPRAEPALRARDHARRPAEYAHARVRRACELPADAAWLASAFHRLLRRRPLRRPAEGARRRARLAEAAPSHRTATPAPLTRQRPEAPRGRSARAASGALLAPPHPDPAPAT